MCILRLCIEKYIFSLPAHEYILHAVRPRTAGLSHHSSSSLILCAMCTYDLQMRTCLAYTTIYMCLYIYLLQTPTHLYLQTRTEYTYHTIFYWLPIHFLVCRSTTSYLCLANIYRSHTYFQHYTIYPKMLGYFEAHKHKPYSVSVRTCAAAAQRSMQ